MQPSEYRVSIVDAKNTDLDVEHGLVERRGHDTSMTREAVEEMIATALAALNTQTAVRTENDKGRLDQYHKKIAVLEHQRDEALERNAVVEDEHLKALEKIKILEDGRAVALRTITAVENELEKAFRKVNVAETTLRKPGLGFKSLTTCWLRRKPRLPISSRSWPKSILCRRVTKPLLAPKPEPRGDRTRTFLSPSDGAMLQPRVQ